MSLRPRALPLLALIPLCAGLQACAPQATDLYGTWANVTDGIVRALDFQKEGAEAEIAGEPDAYTLYYYAEGSEPAEAQRGTYAVLKGDGWELVTTVSWDMDSQYTDQSFANRILDLSRDELVLEVNETDERVYSAVDELP